MEAAIRFSRNSPSGTEDQRFLRINVAAKSFLLCQITKTTRSNVEYEVLHSSTKVPTFRAFDWHPTNESLIAVGQSSGEATLLNIAQGNQDSVSFSIRSQRLCNAVALGSRNLIAVGLDKVRTDFCLNIWDFNQRLPSGASKGFSKSQAEPIHKLAGGEPISSLKFFNQDPRLLAAGVKGQFIRLYDLRESNTGNALQFPTRCVHNLAIDPVDENYFASCYPSNEPVVAVWDRRMVSRINVSPVSYGGSVNNKQPEVSLELNSNFDKSAAIWSTRFSKSKRGCLGVLSDAGHLKVYSIAQDFVSSSAQTSSSPHYQRSWQDDNPRDIFLDNEKDIEAIWKDASISGQERERIVSFDFMTSNTKLGEPKLLVMNGEGHLRIVSPNPAPEPSALSSTGFFCKGSRFVPTSQVDPGLEGIAKMTDQVRRKAESRNALKQAFKQSRQSRSVTSQHATDLRRMSSFANQCWNTDLGFFEKSVPLEDLLKLLSATRLRCMAGYLLDTSKNKVITNDSQWTQSFWSWIDRAERISRNGNMTQDNVDLSYIGVYGVWMEEITIRSRLSGNSSVPVSGLIRNLANRLNIASGKTCTTEYRAHRQLCLHISGLAWSSEELQNMTKKFIDRNQHTKAAALAIFAGEEKVAYQALRSRTAAQSHKMLAMALAGSKERRKAAVSNTDESGHEYDEDNDDDDDDDDWSETIASLSSDLTDPYARAILALVKSGDWADVLAIEALPLKHRVGVAIRHLDDNDLTSYIGRITRLVIANGDIEGVVLTGTGTAEGLGLLSSYARTFNDLQTTILGLSVGGAADRFIANSRDRDLKAKRTIDAFRESYRSQIMRWGLKFDRVRFDVASSRAIALRSPVHKLPRPREQVRLVCTYCSRSLTQFPATETASSSAPGGGSGAGGNMRVHDTPKHPLTSDRVVATGTVCPRCERHLPRCGVCDQWLGTPDETYTKWYTTQQAQVQKNNNINNNKTETGDLTASMTGSVMTTIGPPQSQSQSLSASTATIKADTSPNSKNGDGLEDNDDEDEYERQLKRDRRWEEAMHKFTVFCVKCSHGFHAGHAKMWFQGRVGGRGGHRVCPVPECDCRCNG